MLRRKTKRQPGKSVKINQGDDVITVNNAPAGFDVSPTENSQPDPIKENAAEAPKKLLSTNKRGSNSGITQGSKELGRSKSEIKKPVLPPDETQTVAEKMAAWKTWSTASVFGDTKTSSSRRNLNSRQPVVKPDVNNRKHPEKNANPTKQGSKSPVHMDKINTRPKSSAQKSAVSGTKAVSLVWKSTKNQPKLPKSITESVDRHIFGYSIAKSVRLQPIYERKPFALSVKSTLSATKGRANGKNGLNVRSKTAVAVKKLNPTSTTSAAVVPNTKKPLDIEINKNFKSSAQNNFKNFNAKITELPGSSGNDASKRFRLPLAVDSNILDHTKKPLKTLPTKSKHNKPTVLPERNTSLSFSSLKTTSLNKVAQAEDRKKGISPSTFAKSMRHSSVHIPETLAPSNQRPASKQESYPTAKPAGGPPVQKIIEKIAGPLLSQKNVKHMVKTAFKGIIAESGRSLHSIVLSPRTLKQRASSRFDAMAARSPTPAKGLSSHTRNKTDRVDSKKTAPPAV